MRTIQAGLYLLSIGALALSAAAVDPGGIEITAKKKSVSKREGSLQDLPGGTTQYKEEYVYYEFTFSTTNPNHAGDLTAKWIVALEGAAGRLRVGTRGEAPVKLEFGNPVTVNTEEFKLSEREWTSWRRRGGVGDMGDSIFGYGVQLLGADGEVVAEKFSSPSVKKEYEAHQARTNDGQRIAPLRDRLPRGKRGRP